MDRTKFQDIYKCKEQSGEDRVFNVNVTLWHSFYNDLVNFCYLLISCRVIF